MAGQQEVDSVILIFGTMGMLILALALVVFVVFYQKKRVNQQIKIAQRENEYQRELLNATIEIREKEQQRIAFELHDDIGSGLNAVKMHLSQKNLNESEIENAREQIKNLVIQVRDISNDLLPPVLNELGLNGAISNLCRRLSNQTQTNFQITIPSTELQELKKDIALAIYRIVQEILNNILKHAEANKIEVFVSNFTSKYVIIIQDNGKGFAPPDRLNVQSNSLGLKNIASRVQQIKAELKHELINPQGTKVTLTCKL